MSKRAPAWTWRCHNDPCAPSLTLCADSDCTLLMLSLYGQSTATSDNRFLFSISMDRDESAKFADWLCELLAPSTLTGCRGIFPLRSGNIVGVETEDGQAFAILGGDGLMHDWAIHWRRRVSVSRADLDRLADALTLLVRASVLATTREESRP